MRFKVEDKIRILKYMLSSANVKIGDIEIIEAIKGNTIITKNGWRFAVYNPFLEKIYEPNYNLFKEIN